MNGTQYIHKDKRPLLYSPTINIAGDKKTAIADLSHKTNTFLTLPGPSERYMYDIKPSSVFMSVKDSSAVDPSSVKAIGNTIAAVINTSSKPGETKSFNIVIGLADGKRFTDVQKQVNDLLTGADVDHTMDGCLHNNGRLNCLISQLQRTKFLSGRCYGMPM